MGDNSKHGTMPLNENLRQRRNCLDGCAQKQDRCETGLQNAAACRDRFNKCTTICDYDFA